jgi:hypothetical protein
MLVMIAHKVYGKIISLILFILPLLMWSAFGQWGILVIVHQILKNKI